MNEILQTDSLSLLEIHFEGCLKGVDGCFKGVWRVLQGVLSVFEGCLEKN